MIEEKTVVRERGKRKKHAHPNCPKCTRGLVNYHELCWSVVANMNYRYQKLHRLYRRDGNKFISIGWYCKKCGFIIIEKNQELIVYNFSLKMKKGEKKDDE